MLGKAGGAGPRWWIRSGTGFAVFATVAAALPAGARAQEQTASPASTVSTVVVTGRPLAQPGSPIQTEGTAEQGYRSDTASNVGPLGDVPLQQAPYSIDIVPREFIDNTVVTSTDQVYRINPFTQVREDEFRSGNTYVNVRGFEITNFQRDGLKNFQSGLVPVEDKERIEIFSGLTGFLFGQTDPGGTINYVLKRPTAAPFHELTIGDAGGESGYVHLDIGGPIDREGKFGYRFNLVEQGGETIIPDQDEQKQLYSAAFDGHISTHALLQLDASHLYDRERGVPTSFVAGALGNTLFPKAPPADVLYSQPWAALESLTDQGGARFLMDLTDNVRLRTAVNVAQQETKGGIFTSVILNNGGLIPFDGVFGPQGIRTYSEYAYLDAHFSTGPLDHRATFGFDGTQATVESNGLNAQVCAFPTGAIGVAHCAGFGGTPTPFSLSGGSVFFPEPSNIGAVVTGPSYKSSDANNENVTFGDTISFGSHIQLIAGVTHAEITADSFSALGASTSSYDKSAWSPSVSFVYSPLKWISTYFTYIEGLEQGTIVPAGFTNAGQVLEPLIDTQEELGAKVTYGRILYTLALFRIEKANQFSNNSLPTPTFVQNGLQRNQGVEFSATGKLTDDLSIVGGLTALDATVEQSPVIADNGLRPQNVSDLIAKLYLEYRLPFFHAIVLSGGVNHQSNYAANVANTFFYPDVTTFDLGARYDVAIAHHPVTLRVYATNLGDKSYFQQETQLADPRRVAFSATVKF